MNTVLWLLAVLVVLVSLYALFRVGRSLWRHTKKLAGTVGEAADRVAEATADLQGLADAMSAREQSPG